jgi:heterodisulfide reductase subunit A-like polyferredoxin
LSDNQATIPLAATDAPAAPPIGAVLVVGGGIAGMQASLDLADQGFRVHLVESKSAIGGHMAQLDKTFPTNDCAMCTISPKLVETGRHLNIDLHVDSEVVTVDGQAGDFTATLRHKPRYIDLLKCVGCGDCVAVCPVVIPDPFNEALSPRRAAFKLYPQAVPNAYAIEKLGISPCRDACPAGQRAQGYIALIREGRFADALRVIKEDNPFPGICGRICNHRCETACNRGLIDEPVNIRALKRFVTDRVYAEPRAPLPPAERKYDARVAIIGAGPCGLTTAQDLARLGYPVTVFEALPVAGGMLRVGVPEYRLPAEIIEREVADILDLGIDLRLNTRVDNLDTLFEQGYRAVLVSVGAHEGVRLPLPGANLPGVLVNTHFLRDVRLGLYQPENGTVRTPDGHPFGPRVLVLGGGNVAIDVARSAVRLGAHVELACVEPRDRMPCHPSEAKAAEEEGVILHPGRSFLRIVEGDGGHAAGVECSRVTEFSFDAEGRLAVETEPGSQHVLEADTIIFSVGQRAGLAFIPEDAGVGITRQRTIAINPNTMAATRPGVFAAGDSVSGTAFVIEAVASGHQAAESIHRYLQGDALEPPAKPELPVVNFNRSQAVERLASSKARPGGRVPLPELPVAARIGNFDEVERGYTDELAQAEAARCLSCAICSECLSCQYACKAQAINHNDVERRETVQVGAVILAPGYQIYNAELSQEYGLGRYPNVVTSLQFERLLSASGPTAGKVLRPSDGKPARRIAFLQCVGSRDASHDYCSAVCCMYAAKEAVMAREHDPETRVHIFMMDMRAFSKGYEAYYQRARKQYGIEYTRCRISGLRETPETGDLVVRYVPEGSGQWSGVSGQAGTPHLTTHHSPLTTDVFDLVVLSVGMEMSQSVRDLGRRLGVELDEYGFCHTSLFQPVETSRPGIFAAGPFREPKDIPETVVEASAAAARAAGMLAGARGALTRVAEYPPERDVAAEEPRLGVFVCHCGSNIGGFLDVPGTADYARTLPGVVHAEHNLYTCSQDSIAHITQQVKDLGLNRVVVASCTPRTHGALFQDSLRAAGLNSALFEMANIRNQCSWVHSHDRQAATEKAQTLIRMAAGRARTLEPLHTTEVPVVPAALVLGGGVAGMTAAVELARGGFAVHLIEREAELGGNLRFLFASAGGAHPRAVLDDLTRQIEASPRIQLHLRHTLAQTTGFVGNFTSTLKGPDDEIVEVRHGAAVVATGGEEYRGPEYGYGTDPRILTGLEFEALMARFEPAAPSTPPLVPSRSSPVGLPAVNKVSHEARIGGEGSGVGVITGETKSRRETRAGLGAGGVTARLPNEVAFLLCVGPAERYCGRICCSTALRQALALKRANPAARITVLYRDLRAYGFRERLYTEARQAGVLFVRYEPEAPPRVEAGEGALTICVNEPAFGEALTLHPDLLVLSTPMVPRPDARQVASTLKVPLDADGFFLEAHIKLRPVDFATEGFFLAGAAHYPKTIDETIVQAQAAAARAARLLSRPSLAAGGAVAQVDPAKCVACLTCVRICPFDVPQVQFATAGVGGVAGAAFIEPSVCRGCGVCVAECPAKAITLANFGDDQIMVKLESLFAVARGRSANAEAVHG